MQTNQTDQIDFTKPLELIYTNTNSESADYEIVQVISHNFTNPQFRNAVIIRRDEKIYLVGVNQHGNFSSDNCIFYEHYKLQNKKEIIREIWVNLYKDGSTGCDLPSKESANANRASGIGNERYAYFVTKKFSDSSITNEIFLIQE
jgi:hypothetical protein